MDERRTLSSEKPQYCQIAKVFSAFVGELRTQGCSWHPGHSPLAWLSTSLGPISSLCSEAGTSHQSPQLLLLQRQLGNVWGQSQLSQPGGQGRGHLVRESRNAAAHPASHRPAPKQPQCPGGEPRVRSASPIPRGPVCGAVVQKSVALPFFLLSAAAFLTRGDTRCP